MKNNDLEINKRRSSTNIVLGLILAIFVMLIFSVTVVKLSNGDKMQAYDHVLRPEMLTDE
ncbi:MAG: cytochrome C oxidase assembly protein [Rhodobacterales bacterium]|nr:cytochrome C oxidase assembly protein [Rhodobacterales bacterium]|tara:strand:+ start:34 stop:213 length:180 start_codon:yes stop_codon:yes gene_type:complete